jgi:hypothetical protein
VPQKEAPGSTGLEHDGQATPVGAGGGLVANVTAVGAVAALAALGAGASEGGVAGGAAGGGGAAAGCVSAASDLSTSVSWASTAWSFAARRVITSMR